jgi:hypothetical protein
MTAKNVNKEGDPYCFNKELTDNDKSLSA